jgi:hypothetical protein
MPSGSGSFIHSFITRVAEAHLSNASPFQTPLVTLNQQTKYVHKTTTSKVMGKCVALLDPC